MRKQWVVGLVLVAFVLAGVMGCAKVTKGNYDKINNGMTIAEVENILGPGTKASGAALGGLSGDVYTWADGQKKITVTFANGKVIEKHAENLGG